MEPLPRNTPSLCSFECSFPRSLILFLQSAPPTIVLSAFQADCESQGVAWCSAEAQMLAVEWFVRHPVVKKYPPRRRMVRALLKAYINSVEEQYAADYALSSTSSEDPVQTELMEEFIRVSVFGGASEQGFCFKTFYNPFASAPDTPAITSAPATSTPPSGPSMPLSAIPTPSQVLLSMASFSSIRVSCEQFSNVGLSLWPAAFVMIQLLAQELKGQTHMLADVLGLPRATSSTANSSASPAPLLATSNGLHPHTMPTPLSLGPTASCSLRSSNDGSAGSSSGTNVCSSPLRILELGAGVGLTPVYLHHMKEYQQHVASFLATDYQESIVDNMRFNMTENGIRLVSESLAAQRGLERGPTPPLHRAALLDWLNHADNEEMFMEDEVDVTLVADCIYDTDVIPALVDTIHLALTARSTAPYTSGTLKKKRCCIVVQTHRQDTTMQKFFSSVLTFGQVRSYNLVRQVVGSLRISEDHSGDDGGCVPLGGWDRQAQLLNPDQVVCALVPDVILEDGSMRSASGQWHDSGANETATAAEALLADGMIGPFYTSMVGLIGVHVITLKAAKVAR
ncbi:putative methyltransferase family protein [Leishmania donovani]|uniref:Putative methyltransferase family protein n=1 Tax=Leishmania donovani TaxID=5661 RepID=A0A504WYL8_LEIDO|nr:putative methyltransferase family protein [Leishmania donovani]